MKIKVSYEFDQPSHKIEFDVESIMSLEDWDQLSQMQKQVFIFDQCWKDSEEKYRDINIIDIEYEE